MAMINRFSNLINHNRLAAKISQVLCSSQNPLSLDRLKSIWVASEISGSLAVVVDRVSASDWKTEIWELDESSDNTDLLSGPVARIIEIIQLAAFTMGPKAKLRDSA